MRYVKIFDSTLRDGEQSPGFSMTAKEKIKMALALELLGVDVIEAGFLPPLPEILKVFPLLPLRFRINAP